MVKIKVGDEVVVNKPEYEDKEEQVDWVLSIDDYENSVLTVSDIDPSCSGIFQVEGTHWWFHPNWVTHVNGIPVNKEIPPEGDPSKQERPYENWKMSISKDKFVRCISDSRILDYQTVEGIVGFLNKDESIFYYSPSANKYIAAKVYPFKYPDDSEGWEFVKENCDSLQKSVVPEVNDALVSRVAKKSDILETVESTKNSILASFGVPEDGVEVVTNPAVYELADSLINEDEYTGGSVNYYKLLVEKPTNLPEPYEVECNDIIEALDMNYAEGNAFKAIWRKCAAKKFGIKKKGYDNGLYDSEKVVFFGERMVEQSK